MKQGYTKYQCNEANKAKQHADTKYSKYSPDKICVQSSRNRWVQPSRLPCYVFCICLLTTNKNPNANKLSWVIN